MEGTVKDRAARVLDRVERAAVRSGRSPGSIRLVAVSKTHPVERVAEAYAAGLRVFGENYVQEAEEKVRAFPDAEWHLIGRLQSNKARKAASLFGWVQSVDSLRLLAELSRRCVEGGARKSALPAPR